jgi:hypothetical protein
MDDDMHLGRWWLPDRPQRRVFGLLHMPRGESITLSLAGVLIDASPGASATIVGSTQDGVPVTLLHCLARRGSGV